MHQQRVAGIERHEEVLAAAIDSANTRALQSPGEPGRKWPPQVGAAQFDAIDPRAAHRRVEPAADRFHLGELGHRRMIARVQKKRMSTLKGWTYVPVGAAFQAAQRGNIPAEEESVADDDRPLVLRELTDGVLTLTLNRGERFNPLSLAMIAALDAALGAAARDPSVRVVVLAASGRGFSAGHDLKEMRAHAGDEAWQRSLFDACGRMMVRITELPQPVIARVHGIATAAGCQLVSMCDLAVAADTAAFALPGVNIGVFCTTPAVGVARNIGRKHATEPLLVLLTAST